VSGPIALFEVNPLLDREALAAEFARNRRVQIRDILTDSAAREIHKVLSRHTPWGVSWTAGEDGPHFVRREALAQMTPQQNAEIGAKLNAAMRSQDYAFVFSSYGMLNGYLEQWNPGGPHDIILEYINEPTFLDLVRDVTRIPELKKADAQATLFAPGHFLAQHNDSHMDEGWRIAYVMSFTLEPWRPEWGGYLLFHDDEGDVLAGFKPRFNALNLFAVPQHHQVTYVPPFAPVGRYGITGWFRDR
jgi:Rps23 Pro-64 3,4-dihydroxylase Tpa1-like proline 4-hydroxylase